MGTRLQTGLSIGLVLAGTLSLCLTQDTGTCHLGQNEISAGLPSDKGVLQNTVSCRGNISGNYEVHVVGVYDNATSNESDGIPKTTKVTIQGETTNPVVLVLVNTNHVTWTIEAQKSVPLAVVLLMSDSAITKVDLSKARNTSYVPIQRQPPPSGAGTLENATQLVSFLSDMFLSVTSFTATNKADHWVLRIGPPTPEQNCFESADCWLQYNFTYQDNWNDCHGQQFVRRTSFSVGKYLGVVLCSSTRYKLFMADNLQDVFLNMADGSGSGQDHCELIGGDESSARLSGNTMGSPTATGYYRSFSGETPKISKIGFGPKDLSEWTGRYYPKWYECGVEIPGESRVIQSSLPAPSSVAPTAYPTTRQTTQGPVVTTPSPIDPAEACLSDASCWLQYNFTYDDSWTACSGLRYVTRLQDYTDRYIGLILCSPQRYKLLMAGDLTEQFLNIGDGSGAGEDLCDLIGGSEKMAVLPSDFWNSPARQGFYKTSSGFQRGKVGFGPSDRSEWTGRYYTKWYECGVEVPGQSRVVVSSVTPPPVTTTTTTATPLTSPDVTVWDDVTFGQVKFTQDRTFVVPEGVTKVDVICIGGGGGGRDGHARGMVTGNGGDSRFGALLIAGGGGGAQTDNSGGEGGNGTVANGGQGGKGGGCSAGAGAAGQTSGGGHNGLEAGSSTYPFCGGGGSSGGSSCGSTFGTISPGLSGPGGLDPKGRAGGFYGGGGGSRAGGRAGGGGGYSRAVIEVNSGQLIPVYVGEKGTPAYWAGQPAPGIVVVSWGGPINPTGSFVNPLTVSNPAPPTTTEAPTTPITTLPRKTCDFTFYCSGSFKMEATCVNGYCECEATGYNRYTCLPEVGSCRILPNQKDALGVPFVSSGTSVHSCVGSSANSTYEVHVIGIYENTGSRSSVRTTTVNINGSTRKPMVLVLSSYEPVHWVITADPGLDINNIQLFSYSHTESTVNFNSVRNSASIVLTKSRGPFGYGDDSGGGNTAGLLAHLVGLYGDVASFTGTYRAQQWNLNLPSYNTPSSVSTTTPTPSTTVPPTSPTINFPRKTCRSYCSGGYRLGASCVSGYCECTGKGYNRYTCLPEVGSCRILSNQKDALGVPSVRTSYAVHSCVGSSENSTYEVHVIGIYENTGSRSSVGTTTVNINGSTRKPMVLVLSSYEPVHWVITADPGLDINNIQLFSYYHTESTVNFSRVRNSASIVLTKSRGPFGYGDDSGGGNTAGLLAHLVGLYGDVASFTGTYRAQQWNLNLPSYNTPSSVSTTTPTPSTTVPPTSPAISLPRKTCRSYCSGGYRLGASCVSGYCECTGKGYNRYTCLPEVGSCRILSNQKDPLGVPSVRTSYAVHSCVGSSENSTYEVHVIGIYENTGSRSSVGTTTVNINGSTRKPMVLVLSSYEPVHWVITADPDLDINNIQLFSYYHTESTVNFNSVQNSASIVLTKSRSPFGYGDDSGGGNTAGLLAHLVGLYGDVASFTGTYRAQQWNLNLPNVTTPSPRVTPLPVSTTTPGGVSEECFESRTCWLQSNFTYDNSWSSCSGRQFVRRTPYHIGKYIGVILCSSTRYNLVMADNLEDTFLNIGDGNGAGEDLCELIGGDVNSAKVSSDFWDSPSAEGYYRYNGGDTFEKGKIGYGPKDGSAWTGKYFPTWYECGVSIPEDIVLVNVASNKPGSSTSTTISTTTTTTTTTEGAESWDSVPFGQRMFKTDGVFVVPEGVTKVDVICIGGGGGGRDNHVPFSRNQGHGGNGGNSSFGDHLWAEGGKGANKDNSGGEGGAGTTADGGQGGIGGGCSAGAGAAGQTSGGGHGGLEAGSSTHPFCGAGGSSGGSSCGNEFENIAPGTSGPGGENPVGRAGGLYGGGGGSRAGARAGGGGGYSRAVISVTPGEEIPISVGGIGKPFYPGGRPAPGVVVVSWGGPIKPTGSFTRPPIAV